MVPYARRYKIYKDPGCAPDTAGGKRHTEYFCQRDRPRSGYGGVSINFDNYEMMHIAKYALDHDMTMNTYYFARPLNIHENTKNSVENLSDDCVYLFRTVDNDNDRYDPKDLGLQLYEADGYILGTTFVL